MRLMKDIAIIAAIQIVVGALRVSNKIYEWRHGYLWGDERYKMP